MVGLGPFITLAEKHVKTGYARHEDRGIPYAMLIFEGLYIDSEWHGHWPKQ